MKKEKNIGTQFEIRVLNLFKEELENNRLSVNPQFCKIYHQKGYYSRDRNNNIIVDISIEVFLPEASEYSFLIVLECKDYKHSIPVSDVEEFFAKLQQISGANVKGIVVSSNAFQEGALKYSKSKGIGLVRILENDKFKWILKRAITGIITYKEVESAGYNIQDGLTDENYLSTYIDFFSYYDDQYTCSARSLFNNLLKPILDMAVNSASPIQVDVSEEYFVPFIPREEIEVVYQNILKSIEYKSGVVSIANIIDHVKNNFNTSVTFKTSLGKDELGFEILGLTNFDPSTILISEKGNENPNRKRFTITHELGHIILKHGNYLIKEYCAENDIDLTGLGIINVKDIRRLEWQANFFASCLLLPKENFLIEFFTMLEKLDIKNRGFGHLFVDRQECNINNYYKITNTLKQIFGVSRKAISIRLKNLDLLKDPLGIC